MKVTDLKVTSLNGVNLKNNSRRTFSILALLVLLLAMGAMVSIAAAQPPTTEASKPAFAFNGAYVTYKVTYVDRGTTTTGTATSTISNLDTNRQEFAVSTTYSASFLALPGFQNEQSTGTYSTTSFPALSTSQLQWLKNARDGDIMNDFGGNVKTKQSVSVQAGTFNTNEIVISSSSSLYFELNSGIIVKAITDNFGDQPGTATLELQSTNISTGSSNGTSYLLMIIIVVIVVIVVVVVVLSLLLLRRKRSHKKVTPTSTAMQFPPPPPTS
jgi:hypothetical protein